MDRNPEALSQFIYRIRGREISPSQLIKSFTELQSKAVPEDSRKHQQQHYHRLYGFLLGLGEYTLEQLPAQERQLGQYASDLPDGVPPWRPGEPREQHQFPAGHESVQ